MIFIYLGKPQKKVIFLVARPIRPLVPPAPLGLVAMEPFFPYIKKSFFFLSGTPVKPPSPLSGPAPKKITFFLFFFIRSIRKESGINWGF